MIIKRKRSNFNTRAKLPISYFQREGFKYPKQRETFMDSELDRRIINFDKICFYVNGALNRGMSKIGLARELGLTKNKADCTAVRNLAKVCNQEKYPTLHFLITLANYFKKPVDVFLNKDIKAMRRKLEEELPESLVWDSEKYDKFKENRRLKQIDAMTYRLKVLKDAGYNVRATLHEYE